MAQIVILGTAAAVPTGGRDYTHLAVQAEDKLVLIDCGGSPMAKLLQMGLDWRQLDDVIVTHYHADHMASLPNLIVGMWLSGRVKPLSIHGLEQTIEKIKLLFELFEWQNWSGLFPIEFKIVPNQENYLTIDNTHLRVIASTTAHSIPSIGLRFESKGSQKAVTYSSDTRPTASVVRLASKTDVLIHEATGDGPGHSSAFQAGEIAHQSEASHLYLIHYPPSSVVDPGELISSARQSFNGLVTLAQDGMRIEF